MSASVWAPGNSLVTVDAESTNLSEVFTATASQVVFNLTLFSYNVGTGSIAVFRGGQRLILGTDWTETSSTSISLAGFTIEAGEIIEVVAVLGSASSASIAAQASAAAAAISETNAAASAASVNFTLSSTSTFTNKTVNLANNTLSGNKAQFDAACSDGNFLYTDSGAGSFPTLNQNTTGSAASVSGTTTAAIAASALGSGTADATTYLRGDRTWQTVSAGIGVGQTWQSVTRAQDTDYTNSTGKPIMLKVFGTASTQGQYFVVTVGGLAMNYAGNVGQFSAYAAFTVLIPVGATYRWSPVGGTLTSVDAAELR